MTRGELRYAVGWAAVVMLVTCIPHAVAAWYTPPDGVYPGILHNAWDQCVYFSWMRQARDGQLFFRNLFTADAQQGAYFHLYSLLLGWLSRIPGVGIPTAAHVGRCLFGVTTLVLVYRLTAFFAEDPFARRCVFWTAALSSGLGWLKWSNDLTGRTPLPVDVWVPEAVTFPSLYTNGLFCVALTLMLGVAVCLLLAERHGMRWAVAAGGCGLLLGNIHSYDVIHLTAVWAAYLVLRGGVYRRFPLAEVRLALVAAVVAAPSVAYMAWLYLAEPVFKKRADTATLSPLLIHYLWGYGLILPLAAAGAVWLWRRRAERPDGAWLLPLAWAAVGIPITYLPFAFQRKLIMGCHLPLAILAGFAVANLARRAAARWPRRFAAGAAAACVLALLAVSNVRFLHRDLHLALATGRVGVHPLYWPRNDLHAFEWLGRHTGKDAVLVCLTTNGTMAPAYSGRRVFVGHWGETNDAIRKEREVYAFYEGAWTSERRREFLRRNRVTHVLFGPQEQVVQLMSGPGRGRRPLEAEPFLTPVFTEDQTTLYAVR